MPQSAQSKRRKPLDADVVISDVASASATPNPMAAT